MEFHRRWYGKANYGMHEGMMHGKENYFDIKSFVKCKKCGLHLYMVKIEIVSSNTTQMHKFIKYEVK